MEPATQPTGGEEVQLDAQSQDAGPQVPSAAPPTPISWKSEYHRKWYREHRSSEYLTHAEQQRCREHPPLIREIRGDDVITCPECRILLEKLPQHLKAEHGMSGAALRKKYGLPKSFPLCSKAFSAAMSDKRGEDLAVFGTETRFKRDPDSQVTPAANSKAKGVWQPRTSRVGDWEIVERRLRGIFESKIADKLKLTQGAISARLRRLGFPRSYKGTSLVFYHGEPFSRKHLPVLIQDWIAVRYGSADRATPKLNPHEQLSIEEAAERLGVLPMWVRDHARRAARVRLGTRRGGRIYLGNAQLRHLTEELERLRSEQKEARARREITAVLHINPHWITHRLRAKDASAPLSEKMGERILAVWEMLKSELRKQGASPKGGRPKKLLPSEEAALPLRYRSLLRDLKGLLKWLRDQDDRISPTGLRGWICSQAKQGRMRTLLFWPQFFKWLEDGFEAQTGRGMDWPTFLAKNPTWRPSEVALDFLGHDYDLSPTTLKDLLKREAS